MLQLFELLFNSTNIGIFIVDKKRNILDVNDYACSIFGYTKEESLGQPASLFHRDFQAYEDFSREAFNSVLNGVPINLDYQFKRKDGSLFWGLISGDLSKNKKEVLWSIVDISERVEFKQKLELKTQLLTATQTLLKAGSWELDLQTKLITASDEFFAIMNIERSTHITLERYLEALLPQDRHIIYDSIGYLPAGRKTKGINLRVIHKKSNYCEIRYIFQKGEPVFDEFGIAIKLAGATIDITEQKEAELLLKSQKKLLIHQNFHDSLTGLPNRELLLDRLNHLIQFAQRKKEKLAILFIDLDDFKSINDSYGHHIGDKYLVELGKKIQSNIRSSDTLARIGGDEFVILLDEIKDESEVIKIINKDINISQESLNIADKIIFPQMSIGIALYPADGEDANTLLKNADAAMYHAKKTKKHSYDFYDLSLTSEVYNRVNFTKEIKQAIKNDEFVLYYQPQINAKEHTFIGVEALIRWNHPTKGFLNPGQFLPMVEELGLIIAINRWVIKTAFKQLYTWHKNGLNHGTLSINMSAKQLECIECYDYIKDLLKNSLCQAKWILFELTEDQFINNSKEAILRLNKLCDLGFQIAIDDFGTGYSSLSYLSKLPINGLKIDKSFIDNVPHKKDDVAITKIIIELAKNLNLDVIAEGVEKAEQKKFLLDNGCDNIQGYYYSKPLPLKEVEKFMREF